jgi:bis(5'-adenosyl)-triphosphatase
MLESDSPFLQDGECAIFYESPLMLALYNIAPVVPGHSLIIPRRTVARMADLTEAEQNVFMSFALQVAEGLSRVFQASDFNWIIQDGHLAGQTIDHVHLHLIPRHDGDFPHPGDWYPHFTAHQNNVDNVDIDSQDRLRLNKDEMCAIVDRLKLAFEHL